MDRLPSHHVIRQACRRCVLILLACLAAVPLMFPSAAAEDEPRDADKPVQQPARVEGEPVPLNKNGTVLLDKKNKRVILKTKVVQRERSLELFCCLKGTKEHESILSLDAKAYVVHAGLLALGAKPGAPARNDAEYQPPTGQKIFIFVNWTDADGKTHRESAKSWVRQAINRSRAAKLEALPEGLKLPPNSELQYDRKRKELSWYGPMTAEQKDEFLALSKDKDYRRIIETFYLQSQPHEMEADWIFAGSGTFTDEETGKNFYLAEDGDLICVANFASAMIDVSIPSTATDASLEFEAYTDRIPELGTEVTVELIPSPDKKTDAPPSKSSEKNP